MDKITDIKWLDAPEEHDYPAAASYLALLFDADAVKDYIDKLKQAPISFFKSKDIFRASALSILGISNSHVKKDKKRFPRGSHYLLYFL